MSPETDVSELLDERDNLAILVRRLVRVVTKEDNGNTVANQALDYLQRKELFGSPIRETAERLSSRFERM